jgi:hypothetical protein
VPPIDEECKGNFLDNLVESGFTGFAIDPLTGEFFEHQFSTHGRNYQPGIL